MVDYKNIGIVIQARMASNRLPGKILKKLPFDSELTILDQIIVRAQSSKLHPKIVIATSDNPENDVLDRIASKNSCHIFKGDENDVLSRYYFISQKFKFNTIIRLTADSPFCDPKYIDLAIESHLLHKADYTYTKGLPLGMNIEIISFPALEKSFKNAKSTSEKEHVTEYLNKHPELFSLNKPMVVKEKKYSNCRLTVDNLEDYALACLIYKELYGSNKLFGFEEIRKLINKNPWILMINEGQHQKKNYQDFNDERNDAILLLSKNEFYRSADILKKHER